MEFYLVVILIILCWLTHYLWRKETPKKKIPPTWTTQIERAPKDAVMLILRELAKSGDSVTARSVCRKSWFEDHVIKQVWYNHRACALFKKFANYPMFVIPKDWGLYSEVQTGPLPAPFIVSMLKSNGVGVFFRLNQHHPTLISFHLEPAKQDSRVDFKIIGVFDKVLWLKSTQ